LLKFESNLVCTPCHHGKMITISHSLVNTVMTEEPEQLSHMDTVGLSRICSMDDKWYDLVIVDEHSHCSWVFFLGSNDEVSEYFRSLTLRLNNEHSNCLKAIRSDNETEFRMSLLISFVLSMMLINSFLPCVCPNRMELNKRTSL
jgi:hypothetical protein